VGREIFFAMISLVFDCIGSYTRVRRDPHFRFRLRNVLGSPSDMYFVGSDKIRLVRDGILDG
jgi:hypothetical protein